MRGVLPDSLSEEINPAELTTFGLMNDMEEPAVREITGALLDQGYLERDDRDCLRLNDQSRAVLYGKRRAVMKRGTKNRKEIGGEDLFQALQRLRYEISAREYVAASALFSDVVLRDLCRALPRTRKQLAAVEGMGVFKANRYGDQILQVIGRYAPEAKPEKSMSSAKTRKESGKAASAGTSQTCRDRVIARGNTEAYQSWSEKEDQQLVREYEDGKTIREMSEVHRRTSGAIRSRLKKLGQ
jgi:ribonuclease D